MYKQFFIILSLLTTCYSAISKSPYPRNYICYKASESISIDGDIYTQSWVHAEWSEYFIDIEGLNKPEPYLKTRVKMLWDDNYFYIAAEMEEPHIWATLTTRESIIFYDNDFEVFIDPDGDNHNYYEFEINAFGTEWDLMLNKPYKDGGYAINAWNINGIKSAVKIYGSINQPEDIDEKWTVELALPWSVFFEFAPKQKHPGNGDQWRLNFSRVEWQTEIIDGQYIKKSDPESGKNLHEMNWVWSPQGVINMHNPETWGFVQFSEKNIGSQPDEFIYDIDFENKMILIDLYKKQRNYKYTYGKYAETSEQLTIKDNISDKITIETTSFQYVISIKGKSGKHWHINHERKLWYE